MSFAAFRKSEHHDDLGKLAEQHLKHDLEPSDRDALVKASKRVTLPATLGTLLGLGLGVYAAVRLRKVRADMFSAFRAAEKPSHVIFADGRKEAIPDVTPLMRPSRFGDIATYFFFGLGGTILGGELGFLLGTWSATRAISKDPARRSRIENAYRKFRADMLRQEASRLESGSSPSVF
ncbi:Uu.00g065120.m01.CDS01 [Anthostomella pinea]|uniref:Uu.00g065120.m01.CDS01 n=1 Tax=Anthostomella pinea TaxID=933095 RepID=A0AAI8VTN8_9PEZI|nr:Uu.00g065120.m01.CDS01 [Anthostomella pinea]